MKKLISAALAVMFTTLVFAGMAEAAPTDVSVRIEGKNATLFDRIVKTDGHDIQAEGDSTVRKCDSTNLSAHELPGPTPTAASVDAMTIIGTDFGASWYDGFEDYFIERWGPEAEDDNNAWWWGILVNRDFTPVGGCQFQLVEGDEVLWVYDAFNGRPMLSLEGPTSAIVGEPIEVNVTDFTAAAYQGATVSGLTAAAVPVSPEITVPGTSTVDGTASVTFNKPGWKRLKAYDPADEGEGIADAVPSNSIDICVEREAGVGCTGMAPSQNPAQVGQAPAVEIEEPGPPDPEPTCETDPALCPNPPDPEGASKLRIRNIDMGLRRIRAGGSAKISVTVRNAGDAASGATRACLRSGKVRVNRPCRDLGILVPGQERSLKFTVKGAKSLRGPAKLPLRLTVTEGGTAKLNKTVRLGVTRKR